MEALLLDSDLVQNVQNSASAQTLGKNNITKKYEFPKNLFKKERKGKERNFEEKGKKKYFKREMSPPKGKGVYEKTKSIKANTI